MEITIMPFLVAVVIPICVFLMLSVRVLKEWERGIVQTFGRFTGVMGPGLRILIPVVQNMLKVDTRVITMDVPPQDIITKDNVSLKVNAVVYFRVVDPAKAINEVEDYYFATSQMAQTSLRSILGQYQLDELLSHRDKINQALQNILDKQTDPWGVKITLVEIKHIDLPKEMQRAMAREAEAERERRAKVISAEGELERAHKLAEASNTLATSPSAMQLAYMQTLTEITNDKSSTIVFPLPLDLIKPFLDAAAANKGK